jgi:glucose-6-phosphate isomerase
MSASRRRRLTDLPAWQALMAHYRQIHDLHLRQLFADDPLRGERLTAESSLSANVLIRRYRSFSAGA